MFRLVGAILFVWVSSCQATVVWGGQEVNVSKVQFYYAFRARVSQEHHKGWENRVFATGSRRQWIFWRASPRCFEHFVVEMSFGLCQIQHVHYCWQIHERNDRETRCRENAVGTTCSHNGHPTALCRECYRVVKTIRLTFAEHSVGPLCHYPSEGLQAVQLCLRPDEHPTVSSHPASRIITMLLLRQESL